MSSPIEVLREAIRAVPAVRYALGVAGILAAVALIGGFGLDAKTTVFGALGMLMLMVVLVVFARLTKTAPRHFVAPMLVLMWSVLLITVASAALLFTAVFFDWPRPLSQILVKPAPAPAQAATLEQEQAPDSATQTDIAPGPSAAITRAIQVARSQSSTRDFAGAWDTLAAQAEPNRGPELERERVLVAMAWLRDGRPGPGRTFTQLVEPLLPPLHRAVTGSAGAESADALAHIGWGHFLKTRDGVGGLETVRLYEQAIARDPNNPFAHAMWAHWILWRSNDLAAAARHFDAALASGREGAYVRHLALSAYTNRDAVREAVATVLSMQRAGDSLSVGERERIASRLYSSSDPKEWSSLVSAFDPRAHLAGFEWLTVGEDFRAANLLALRRAQLVANAGECERAKPLFEELIQRELSIISESQLRSGLAACRPPS